MRNLFDNLTNTLGQFTKQGNPDQNSRNSSGGSRLGQIGAMGVGGLLGALLNNPKSMKGTLKKAAMIGGGAALGGLAYSIYQKWKNNPGQGSQGGYTPYGNGQQGYQSGGFPQQGGFPQGDYQSGGFPQHGGYHQNGGFNQGGFNQGSYNNGGYLGSQGQARGSIGYQAPTPTSMPRSPASVPAGNNPFASYNAQQASAAPQMDPDALSDLLLEAMVFAARADNHIDADEQQMIMKVAQELNPSQDLMQKLSTYLNEPLDPRTLARKLQNPEMAVDVYRLSAAAIVADTQVERQYLQSLARALNLSAQQVQILDQEAQQFRQQARQG